MITLSVVDIFKIDVKRGRNLVRKWRRGRDKVEKNYA
jgi:hypothetical protein